VSHVNDRSAQALAQIKQIVAGDLQSFAENMVEIAKDTAPIDTGNLRSSITMRKVKDDELRVQTECGYGAYQELGTSRHAAQPFFAPAFEQSRSEFNPTKTK